MGGRIVPVKFAMYTHALQDGDCNYRQDDIPVAPMHVYTKQTKADSDTLPGSCHCRGMTMHDSPFKHDPVRRQRNGEVTTVRFCDLKAVIRTINGQTNSQSICSLQIISCLERLIYRSAKCRNFPPHILANISAKWPVTQTTVCVYVTKVDDVTLLKMVYPPHRRT